jgi:predicted alpha/beta superfamily hydrolase
MFSEINSHWNTGNIISASDKMIKNVSWVFPLLLSINSLAQMPATTSGRLTRHENFKSAFVEPRNVDVWLPDGYNGNEKYAVLYMHDGQMLFDSTTTWNGQDWGVDETIGKLLDERKIQKCIVVAIWNTRLRHIEYFPQKAMDYLTEQQKKDLLAYTIGEDNYRLLKDGPISDNYLRFLVNELKPFIDSTYPTLTGPDHTYIAGSSMGGLISMYALCEYPGVFGGAACLSTHWPGIFIVEDNPVPFAFLAYMRDHLPPPGHNRIYFDYGTETLDAMYEPFQIQADSIMKSKGYSTENWITRKFQGEDHSEQAWKRRLSVPLIFLMGL